MSGVEFAELTSEDEWRSVFPVMRQLRSVDEATYISRVREMRADGYRLLAIADAGEIRAVAGVAIRINLHDGRYVWVYDLVTDAAHRSQGYGTRLLEFVAGWAGEHGCDRVALASRLERSDAHRFYEDHAHMTKTSYVFKQDV